MAIVNKKGVVINKTPQTQSVLLQSRPAIRHDWEFPGFLWDTLMCEYLWFNLNKGGYGFPWPKDNVEWPVSKPLDKKGKLPLLPQMLPIQYIVFFVRKQEKSWIKTINTTNEYLELLMVKYRYAASDNHKSVASGQQRSFHQTPGKKYRD